MNIGILKEVYGGRVVINPETCKKLTSFGHNVFFVSSVGYESGVSDELYIKNGAIKKFTNNDVINECDLITCFKLPPKKLLRSLRGDQQLLCISNIVNNKDSADVISKQGATLIGLEFLEKKGKKDISSKIGKIASNITYNMCSYFYNQPPIGGGRVIGNFPFTKKTIISILGYGNIGKELSKLFYDKNCTVNVFESDINKFDNEDSRFNLYSIDDNDFSKKLQSSDIIISCISQGKKRIIPFINKDFIKKLKARALIFDLSINNGGTFETSRATKLNDPIYTYENILHCCPDDITLNSGKTFSNYISNYMYEYILLLSEGYTNHSRFKNSILIKNGSIDKNIEFINTNDKDIRDPFDLIDDEISLSWKTNEVNDFLDEIDDYNHEI
jgi:alanine dehydrogenase